MQTWQPRSGELIDELRAAEDGVLELVGPRAIILGRGEPMDPGPPIDEAFHQKWVAALARQKQAWDAWNAFLSEQPMGRR